MVTTASATAVCAVVSPNITWRSAACMPNHFCATYAAIHLLASPITSMFSATTMVSVCTITLTSTIIPTPIRKYGMNKALPTNSMRLINGDTFGTNRFKSNPA